LSVTAEERERLQEWARGLSTAQALAQRSRIVLECAAGQPSTVVAGKLGVTHQTVGKWRQRFLERRLDGLLDERPGAPRQVSDAQIERVVRLTLESAPADATHWSTRAMAKRCGLSQTMVSRIWRAFALQPHLFAGYSDLGGFLAFSLVGLTAYLLYEQRRRRLHLVAAIFVLRCPRGYGYALRLRRRVRKAACLESVSAAIFLH
jgi:transposase